MINNRQAGRRRGRGGQQQRSSGGNPGRQDTGNRIDNRARGNAAQLLEKYKTLARDAQMQGDRVNVEYYLQFADHYFRVLAETRARFEENGGAPSTRRIQGATLDEDEPDYEDEGERVQEQPRGDQQRGGQNGNGQQNGYRQDGNRQDGRQDGNRSYNQNGGHQQNGNQNAAPQNGAAEARGSGQGYDDRGRGRANGNGQASEAGEAGYERQADAPREERGERRPRGDRYERQDRVARTPEASDAAVPTETVVPFEGAPAVEGVVAVEPVAEAPRRGRGRPRREPVAVAAVKDAGEDSGFTADRLPPSLNVSAVVESDSEGEVIEKPRRRRGRPPGSTASTPSE
ncbi:MAG: DUF4167 domain-containing protein [Pseudomonadota bacterium]